MACGARPQPCEGVEEVVAPDRMHEVLAKSDYVIIVTPLTEQTRGLVRQGRHRSDETHASSSTTWRAVM